MHSRPQKAAEAKAPAERPAARGRQEQPPNAAQRLAVTKLQAPEHGQPTPAQPPRSHTSLPDTLKAGVEALSGIDMSDVRVHANSSRPAELKAHAYAQGNEIHLGPGQERHLPHEAWHIVQQRQGRVLPSMYLRSTPINTDAALESEADRYGAQAATMAPGAERSVPRPTNSRSAVSLAVPAPIQLTDKDFRIYRSAYERLFNSTTHRSTVRGLLNFPKPSDRQMKALFQAIKDEEEDFDEAELKRQYLSDLAGLSAQFTGAIATHAGDLFDIAYQSAARATTTTETVPAISYNPKKRQRLELPIPAQDAMPYLDADELETLKTQLAKKKVRRKYMNTGFSVHDQIVKENADAGKLVRQKDKDLSDQMLDDEGLMSALHTFSGMDTPDKRGLKVKIGSLDPDKPNQVTFGSGGLMVPGLGTYGKEKAEMEDFIKQHGIKDTATFTYAVATGDVEAVKEMAPEITGQELGWLLRLSKLHVLEMYRGKAIAAAVSAWQKQALFGVKSYSDYMGLSPMESSSATTNLGKMELHKLEPVNEELWKEQSSSFTMGLLEAAKLDPAKSRVHDPTVRPFLRGIIDSSGYDSDPDEVSRKTHRAFLKTEQVMEVRFGANGQGKIIGELFLDDHILESIKTFPKIDRYLPRGIFVVSGEAWTCYIRCILYHFRRIGQYGQVMQEVRKQHIDTSDGVVVPSRQESALRDILIQHGGVPEYYAEVIDASHDHGSHSAVMSGAKVSLLLTGAHFSLLTS